LADGGEVFDHVQKQSGKLFDAQQVMVWTSQLLQAANYLHEHRIGHRDISLENILLKDGKFRLMDFGQAVQTHSAEGLPLRYFRSVGKPVYRAPEAYVPPDRCIKVLMPANSAPGSIMQASSTKLCEVRSPADAAPGQVCIAEACGYEVMPLDTFACGVAFFIIAWQVPLWRHALPLDPTFRFIASNGLQNLVLGWNLPIGQLSMEAFSLLSRMLATDPRLRPTITAVLESPCFASVTGTSRDARQSLADTSKHNGEAELDGSMEVSDAEMTATPVSARASSCSIASHSPERAPRVRVERSRSHIGVCAP
jgi:serine/threonine protein kinase